MGNTTKIYGRLQSDSYADKVGQLATFKNNGELIATGFEIETTVSQAENTVPTTAAIMAWVTANFTAKN